MPDEIAVEQFLTMVGGDDHDGIGVQSGGNQRAAQTSEKLAVEPANLRIVERLDQGRSRGAKSVLPRAIITLSLTISIFSRAIKRLKRSNRVAARRKLEARISIRRPRPQHRADVNRGSDSIGKGRRILLGFVLEPVEEDLVPVINQCVAPGIVFKTEIFEIGNLGEEMFGAR